VRPPDVAGSALLADPRFVLEKPANMLGLNANTEFF
jgi:hypothetical protein